MGSGRPSEINFDGLVGPTHNYAGLSRGNLASAEHAHRVASPRAAALQGIAKMRLLASLGVAQAVLPPQPRPDVRTLRRLGFTGTDTQVLERAAAGDGHLLRLCSSASAMWTANAATVAPSCDTEDGRLHVTVANLSAMFHRSLEASTTLRVLGRIFRDPARFAVHEPLPGGEHLADEGAANHLRLEADEGAVHLFGWGRSAWDGRGNTKYPRRQTREASAAVERLNALKPGTAISWEQDPVGIDGGAFHTDVVAVGNGSFLMLHEHAFCHYRDLLLTLKKRLGAGFSFALAHESELPLDEAVSAYPFNSQIVTLPGGAMSLVAPAESRDSTACREFLERVVSDDNPVESVHWVDVNASMNNGGGPACLRLRVPMTDAERSAVTARVFFDAELDRDLTAWVSRHYRDRLEPKDLADPSLLDESRTALEDLSRLLQLGDVYEF